jgi:aminobenzoyl-glutamate utilization protein B
VFEVCRKSTKAGEQLPDPKEFTLPRYCQIDTLSRSTFGVKLNSGQANLELVGAPSFTEKEQEFARALQRYVGAEEKGFDRQISPLADETHPPSGGSTDVAEVSRIAPTAGFSLTTAAGGVPWHSWAATACHGTEAARKAAVVAAKLIAVTGMDLLLKPNLVEEARAFFEKSTDGKPYISPIPVDQKPPIPSK